jgi:hypothetical protein
MWPWNKKHPDHRESLAIAITEAEAALRSSDTSTRAQAMLHLDTVLTVMDGAEDGEIARARELRDRLEDDARPRAPHVRACPCCGGGELLVAENASIDSFYVGSGGAPLKFTMVVCRACGDMRMQCADVAALAAMRNALDMRCFVHVTVPLEQHPYR